MGKGKAFSTTEVALIQKHASEGKSVRTIATYTKRSPSAVAGVVRGKPKRGAGAPSKLNKRSEVAFLNSLERLQKKADGQYEVRFSFVNPSCAAPLAGGRAFFFHFLQKKVTVDMALSKWKGKRISRRTAFRIFRRRGIKFRAMRERPVLTKEDVVQRFAFSRKFGGKRARFWDQTVAIDGKWFTLALTARHRR